MDLAIYIRNCNQPLADIFIWLAQLAQCFKFFEYVAIFLKP